jgi:guanyl-specific ribonuclease Sa
MSAGSAGVLDAQTCVLKGNCSAFVADVAIGAVASRLPRIKVAGRRLPATAGNAAHGVGGIPEESAAVIRSIQKDGVIVQGGIKGPSVPGRFANDGRRGGQLLPAVDRNGQPINYREWGTVPAAANPKPGGERIVTGSDGSIYYSPDHYQTYIRWEP